MKKTKIYQILLIGLILSLFATIHVPLFKAGFIVTISVILLPFFIYVNDEVDLFKICVATSILSPTIRFLFLLIDTNLKDAFTMVWPDTIFYITYGIAFKFAFGLFPSKKIANFTLIAIFSDFFANFIEMNIRSGLLNLSSNVFKGIVLVAIIRGIVLLFLLMLLKKHELLITKQEHEKRYRNLLNLTSIFKSEVYFMNKNMVHIEEVMENTYGIYERVKKGETSNLESSLLDLTKEVHEIKKNYTRIIQGIKNVFPELERLSEISLKDILEIITLNTTEQLKDGRNIKFKGTIEGNLKVRNHYYLMSILTNLIQNAIESTAGRVNEVSLKIEVKKDILIEVEDSGSGIEDEDLDYIFKPGFSTKFDLITGNIGRGVGLTIIRDIVYEKFKGTIEVDSKVGRGTKFKISIPKYSLKDGSYEDIYC